MRIKDVAQLWITLAIFQVGLSNQQTERDIEDLYSLFNSQENFGASARHQLVIRDHEVTNGPDVVESRVALRTNNTKSAGSGIKRGSLKLIPPSEREEHLRLKKLRFINNVDTNSLFKSRDARRSGKKQALNTKENNFPDYSTSLFDDLPRTNDLINEIDNFDVIEGTATSSTRRHQGGGEDDYGQVVMGSMNETFYQDTKGKNTQIIINLSHNPRSSFHQSFGSAIRPSRPSPVFVPDEVTTPRPTSTTANPDSDTEILVPPPRPGPPGIPLGPPLNLQEDGFAEPPPAPQSALGGSGDPDTFSGYRRSGSSLRRFTSYDNKDTTLLNPGTVLEAVVNELAPSALDGKLQLRTNGPKPNPRSADGGGDNHFSNNIQLDPLGNPVGSYVSIARFPTNLTPNQQFSSYGYDDVQTANSEPTTNYIAPPSNDGFNRRAPQGPPLQPFSFQSLTQSAPPLIIQPPSPPPQPTPAPAPLTTTPKPTPAPLPSYQPYPNSYIPQPAAPAQTYFPPSPQDTYEQPASDPNSSYQEPSTSYQQPQSAPVNYQPAQSPSNSYQQPNSAPTNTYQSQAPPSNNYQQPLSAPTNTYQQPISAPSSNYHQPQSAPLNSYQKPVLAPSNAYKQPAAAPQNTYQLPVSAPSNSYQQPSSAPTNSYQQPISAPATSYLPPAAPPSNVYKQPVSSPANTYQSPPQSAPVNSYKPVSSPSNSYQQPSSDPSDSWKPVSSPSSNPSYLPPSPPADDFLDDYNAPQAPPITYETPAAPPMPSYEAPTAPPMPSYEAPAAPPMTSYEAPDAPPVPSYEAPAAPPAPSYEAPAAPPVASYETPAAPPITYGPPPSDDKPSYKPPDPPVNDQTFTVYQPQGVSLSIVPHPIKVQQNPKPQGPPKPSYKAPSDPTANMDFEKFTISQDGTNALHYHLHVDSPEDFDAIREMMEGYGGGQAANDAANDVGPPAPPPTPSTTTTTTTPAPPPRPTRPAPRPSYRPQRPLAPGLSPANKIKQLLSPRQPRRPQRGPPSYRPRAPPTRPPRSPLSLISLPPPPPITLNLQQSPGNKIKELLGIKCLLYCKVKHTKFADRRNGNAAGA